MWSHIYYIISSYLMSQEHHPVTSLPHTENVSCLSDRVKYIRRGRSLHSVPVWGSEQAERYQGDLHSLHLRHRHQERAICLWRSDRCHHQEQPEGLRTLLETGSYLVRISFLNVTCAMLAMQCVFMCKIINVHIADEVTYWPWSHHGIKHYRANVCLKVTSVDVSVFKG